jgi:hypothetical protein
MRYDRDISMVYELYQIVWSILSWSAVVCMLSLGAKRLNFNYERLGITNIDVGGHFVLPGIIDAHVQIVGVGSPDLLDNIVESN